jgi:hypothetical protein
VSTENLCARGFPSCCNWICIADRSTGRPHISQQWTTSAYWQWRVVHITLKQVKRCYFCSPFCVNKATFDFALMGEQSERCQHSPGATGQPDTPKKRSAEPARIGVTPKDYILRGKNKVDVSPPGKFF